MWRPGNAAEAVGYSSVCRADRAHHVTLALDVFIIIGLILLNALFAMSEIALVSAKKIRLEHAAAQGDRGAAAAVALAGEPTRLLSTVQVGITLITLAQGAFGESAFTVGVEQWLGQWPWLAPYARQLSVVTVVAAIGLASLIFGELVPKRIGLLFPETIARWSARPMLWLAVGAKPLVRLLALTTDALVHLIGRRKADDPSVTEEDIKGLMREGASAGVFDANESHIVSRVFNLDEHSVDHIMTPRADLTVIDVEADPAATLELLKQSHHTRYPVVRGDVSNVIGVIDSGDLLAHYLKSGKLMPERVRKEAVFIPETISVLEALETFKRTRESLALVVDEHGEVLGMVTHTDVLEALVGDLGDEGEAANSDAVRRADGSWLLDGSVSLERFRELFPDAPGFAGERSGDYRTLGGFVMAELGRIAMVADTTMHGEYRLEVVDMDGRRIDKLLLVPPRNDTGV
ncbi:MAG: HlyC/CorC family transporter [Burkholderiales bacterium]|nr:HlyC/CorC family transporter [Burkholderiales bacterium]